MMPAVYTSHRRLDDLNLMVVAGDSSPRVLKFGEMEHLISPNDLLVMNTSGTIPACLWTLDKKTEIRLAAFAGENLKDFSTWWVVSFGFGSWRMPTENRGLPGCFALGDEILFSKNLRATVVDVHPQHSRLMKVQFNGAGVLDQIYRLADPIQYSYHSEKLKLWDVQTLLSQVPISVEAPSALFGFSYERLLSLNCEKAFLVHGAGLSSTGDESLDRLLPLPEYFEIPEETLKAIQLCRRCGGRVIAVGTTVTRALESYGLHGTSRGLTDMKLGRNCRLRVVDSLLTGFHNPGTSHFELEEALLSPSVLRAGFELAEKCGFLGHEYGDLVLLG